MTQDRTGNVASLGELLELAPEVAAALRVERNRAQGFMQLDAVAVELDLVDPTVADRREARSLGCAGSKKKGTRALRASESKI